MVHPNLFRGKYPYFSCSDNRGSWPQISSFDKYFSELEVEANLYLDLHVKLVAMKAAASVVCVITYSGERENWWGSGFIIECDNIADGQFEAIIITSASLLRVDTDLKVVVMLFGGEQWDGEIEACDFHYNIAAIKIRPSHSLKVARLRHIDDCIMVDTSKPFALLPHSNLTKLTPGDVILSLGRYHDTKGRFMVAPGVFSVEQCRFDCKELLRSTCIISKCGIGGPAINQNGEVIGLNFFALGFTPFLPINIVSKWWKLSKGDYCRPWLGMESSNLFTVTVGIWEKIIQKFPNVKKGITVDEVSPNSPAALAGVQPNDIIIKCDEVDVRSSLQFFDLIWDKVGKSVELAAIRTDGTQRTLSVVVGDTNQLSCWPIPA